MAGAQKLVDEGVEARLAAADAGATTADRRALLEEKGDDADKASVEIEQIRRRVEHGSE